MLPYAIEVQRIELLESRASDHWVLVVAGVVLIDVFDEKKYFVLFDKPWLGKEEGVRNSILNTINAWQIPWEP